MLEDGSPALEVGFVIDTSASFDSMARLDTALDKATADAIAEVAKIEKAVGGMLNMGAATASVTAFGAAATRELQSAAREMARVEKSGEAMVRSLERQNASFGKTREQLRAMKAESAATAAEQQGLAELAQRIREQEAALAGQELAAANQARAAAELAAQAKAEAAARAVAASEAEAQALREASFAYQQFEAAGRRGMQALREQEAAEKAVARETAAAQIQREAAAAKQLADEHARLAAMVRGSQAAQEADAVAAERLRAATDPLYAATSRLNAEIAESTRLYHAGATAPAEYARQQEVLADRLRRANAANESADATMKRGAGTLTQLSFQLNDVATMAAMGAPPMQIFASQAGQIFQVAQMAEGGVKGFATEIGALAMRFTPLIGVAAIAGVALYQFKQQVETDAGLKKYTESLALTHKEMKKLGDVSVSTGDLLKGFWQAINEVPGNGNTIMSHLFTEQDKKTLTGLLDFSLNVFKGIAAGSYGLLVGSYRAGLAIWNQFPGALGDIFVQAVNGSVSAIEWLTNKGIDAVNAIARAGNAVLGTDTFGQFDRVTLGRMKNSFKGAGSELGKDIYEAFDGATKEGLSGIDRIIKRTGQFAVQNAQKRYLDKANEIIADRPDQKDKPDHHAEQLARENAAIEAQIAGLYDLAKAYGVSGAAALIAEAKAKAETDAIKKRGDTDVFVARQIRLAIAQRVADAAKSTAGMRDQASAQEQVNAMVAAGAIPAERAAELVKDQIADLALLAAIDAARTLKTKEGTDAVVKATAALADQRAERARLKAAEENGRFSADMSAGRNQLAQLDEELRLVGATDAVRVHQLAVLKATQEAQAKYQDPSRQQQYIAQQVEIADTQQLQVDRQRELNEQLSFTADKWNAIAGTVQSAAQGMADAFGDVGRAIGDMASTYAGYEAQRARLQQDHDAAIKAAGKNEAAIARENQLFTLRSAGAQVGAYGDMAEAAKGFFKEGSAGYEALAAAEKAFRIVQFAMSVQAMVQNAAETLGFVTNAAARATAEGTAGIAAQSKLPFPLNIVAMAATGAALLAAGVAIIGGGHHSSSAPVTNTGTGTVLGDPAAQSESIKNSIDALHEVDTLMLTSSRAMAASLRSIDAQISGFAAEILKAGDINASGGIAEGFKPNVIGSVLGAIPLIGGLLKSLFGTTTKVTGTGLFGGPQTVGSILSGGFNAQYYSDIEKTSKFLGITTGHSTSTSFTAADPALANQFTLILKSFNDAISAAAGPLGESTDAIKDRLSGFVIDIGKIDLTGLTGDQITEKLSAVFGAAADRMASGAFPGIERFQKAGEGAFETLVRVSSTVEAVTASLEQLGSAIPELTIDAKLGLAGQFDTVGDLTSAVSTYFETFYTQEEQATAHQAQMAKVFASLNLEMPTTLAGFRQLVDAQNLNTAAGQATYATLLQLAPAFAELEEALSGAKSAADIATERHDLERQLLELQGDTAALRALDLAKLDASNRALQEQIWAVQDAQEAAKAAEDLRQAWVSVGDSIADEVKRIRGLTDAGGPGGFVAAQSSFNAALAAARAGDQDAAKSLPGLSQALLNEAAQAATSRQELARIQAQTAASLEAVLGWININPGAAPATSTDDLLDAVATSTAGSAPEAANDDTATAIRELREEVAQLRSDNNAGHAATAGNTGAMKRTLENVTNASGGDAVSVLAA